MLNQNNSVHKWIHTCCMLLAECVISKPRDRIFYTTMECYAKRFFLHQFGDTVAREDPVYDNVVNLPKHPGTYFVGTAEYTV